MCYYQNVNNDITLDSFRPVLHWEKCGEILFFSKILCFLEKSLLSFREKSYFFEKRQDFLMIFTLSPAQHRPRTKPRPDGAGSVAEKQPITASSQCQSTFSSHSMSHTHIYSPV